MRIAAFCTWYPPRIRVGSYLTTHEWLRHLAARGHTVTVTTGWSHHRYQLDGVAVLGWEPPGDPVDLVICHAGDSRAARHFSAQVGSPLVVVAHGAVEPHHLAGADLVVFVSDAQRGETGWDGPSVVIPPPVDPAQHRTRRTGDDLITIVNLNTSKGVDLFWALAAAEPHRRFLAVAGGWGRQMIRTLPNVEVIRRPVTDMRPVWARTRILLMPSVAETWGRVALEAAASGIPTIAHPASGLVEALGVDNGVWAGWHDLAAWRRALAELDHPVVYNAASRAARARADQLNPAESLNRFATVVEALAPTVAA